MHGCWLSTLRRMGKVMLQLQASESPSPPPLLAVVSGCQAGKPVLALQRLFVQPRWLGPPRDQHTQAPVHQHKLFYTSWNRGANQDPTISVKQQRSKRNGKGVFLVLIC